MGEMPESVHSLGNAVYMDIDADTGVSGEIAQTERRHRRLAPKMSRGNAEEG